MIVVDIVSVVVIHMVGVVLVNLWAVACGTNLRNLQLHRQGVDLVRRRGGAAVRRPRAVVVPMRGFPRIHRG